MSEPFIVDAQIHTSYTPGLPERPALNVRAGYMGRRTLSREMAVAGVSRAVLVPAPGHAEESIDWAVEEPGKYTVMESLDLDAAPADTLARIPGWKRPGVSGMRITFWGRTPRPDARYRNLLARDRMDWLWEASEAARIPTMVCAPSILPSLAGVATRFPELPIIIDHMGVIPGEFYEDFDEVLDDLLPLAAHPNIAVKVSALCRASQEIYPFPKLHEPIRRVFDAFGPERTFWGTDLSTLTIPYRDYVDLFLVELDFLGEDDRRQVMGEAICRRLDWPMPGRSH